MVSTPSAIINNSTHYFYQGAPAGSHENRAPSKIIIHTTKSKPVIVIKKPISKICFAD